MKYKTQRTVHMKIRCTDWDEAGEMLASSSELKVIEGKDLQ